MRLRLAVLCVVEIVVGQQLATLTQPQSLETSVFRMVSTNGLLNSFTTNVTFMQNYNTQPAVFVSLVTLSQLTPLSLSTLQQSVVTITNTQFMHYAFVSMSISNTTYRFTKLEAIYVAFDFSTYSFLQLHDSIISIPTTTLNNIYLKIGYISSNVSYSTNSSVSGKSKSWWNSIVNSSTTPPPDLNSSRTYSLNVVLSGFTNLLLVGKPTLYVDAVQQDDYYYLLNVIMQNVEVQELQILRILIDTTAMQAAVTGPSSLICTSGTVVHLSDPNSVQHNDSPDFLPFAMLYGIKGWVGLNFSLSSFTYLFNNTNPRVQLNIGYILFQTSSCPANELYVASQNLCYTRSAAFYYQLTPQTMAPCPVQCYTCVGPLSTQCQSCVEGWNRHYVAGRCLCITGFYSSGEPVCKNCTEAIAGCYTCSSATNCLTCLPGCTAINFSPIYCDCPSQVQNNYSYNCPTYYYYQYDKNECQCLPQTFEYKPGICFPCDIGCYICVGTSKHCLVCINAFTLVNNSCIYFTRNYALLGQGVALSSPYNRCLRWDATGSSCLQKCKKYYYNSNCYGACPIGTFNISTPWLTCQPCKLTCKMCFNFTVCYVCQPNYFYFNTSTFACSPCSQFCVKCLNASYCTSCQANYDLTNNTCTHASLTPLNCSQNCAYCVIDDWCLGCKGMYYLNSSDHSCYSCSSNPSFGITASGSCIEICGDGIVVFADCDDGNLVSGDGCSSNCTIQKGFVCHLVNAKSYCWKMGARINWQILPTFGANQFTLFVASSTSLTSSLLNLTCSFNHTIADSSRSGWAAKWVINYNQTILMSQNQYDEQNIRDMVGTNTANRCFLGINGVVKYTIIVNTSPELLFIDYSEKLQSYTQNGLIQLICQIGILTILCIAFLGLMPVNIFAAVRVFQLALSTYLDYYFLPLNSFKTLGSFMTMLFMRNAGSSSNVIIFEADYYFEMLWKVSAIYSGVFLLHVWVLKGVLRFANKIDWKGLTKVAENIQGNKELIYQTIYTSYEAVILTLLSLAFRNVASLDVKLLVFMTAHIIFFILTKIHFYLTMQKLFEKKCSIRYCLISDQFQNITIAFLATLSNANISYAPIAITLFATYNLYSLVSSHEQVQSKDTRNLQFRVTNNIAIWQYGVNLVILIALQIMKCTNMWRGVVEFSLQKYQSMGSLMGIWISFTLIGLIMINFVITVLSLMIRIWELNIQTREESEVATIDNISGEASVANDYNN